MRITNNMITNNTKININGNKINVDKYNTQMTTQKKIAKASENPVIAIRSLRLSTSLSHVNQYVDNNIPDAQAWLDVTETALTNMKDILRDVRTLCVKGSTDTHTAEDRETILKQLNALSGQVYSEGNADYAGRTVFTGYRTGSKLTFETAETTTSYDVEQNFSYEDLMETRFYSGSVEVPKTVEKDTDGKVTSDACETEIVQSNYDRIRVAYDKIAEFPTSISVTKGNGATSTHAVTVYENYDAWEKAGSDKTKKVGEDEIIFIKDSGEMIFGKTVSNELKADKSTMTVNYTKNGFAAGELRPEYYFKCTKHEGTAPNVVETKYNQFEDGSGQKDVITQEIQYTIANNTNLTVNTQARDVFNSSIARDMQDMTNIVKAAIEANDKVEKIKSMMKDSRYADAASQEYLQGYLDAAKKEADYADDNLQKTYGQYITNFDNYMNAVTKQITNVGSMTDRLKLTQTRVSNQQSTIEELKTSNEDRELSDIIIDYYASYNAYQSSLTAAAKVGKQTLLDYL